MATISITIPDAVAQRVYDALASKSGATAIEAKAALLRHTFNAVRSREVQAATTAAHANAQATIISAGESADTKVKNEITLS